MVFRKEEVIDEFIGHKPNKREAARINNMIYQTKKEKYIKKVPGRRGIYFIVPIGKNYKDFKCDPFLLAANLATDGIICYGSALMAFGKSHSMLNLMYFSSIKRFRQLKYQGMHYKYVVLPKRDVLIDTIHHKGTPLRITSIERTLIDCLNKFQYAGGFEELYNSYLSVSYMNWEKLLFCLKRFSSPVLYARAGFFVELFKDKWGIPERFFAKAKKKIPKHTDYFIEHKRGEGKLVKKWNIIVPQEVLHLANYND